MSCLIGYKSGNTVYVGADGAATTDDGEIRPIKTEKIIRIGDYLIGYVGSIRAGQIIESVDPPELIEDLIEAIRLKMEESGCLVSSEGQTQISQSCLLIVQDNNLYEMLSDFQLNKIEGSFTTLGCGSSYAFGAMHVIQEEDLSPSEKIIKALEVTSHYHSAVRPPYEVEKY